MTRRAAFLARAMVVVVLAATAISSPRGQPAGAHIVLVAGGLAGQLSKGSSMTHSWDGVHYSIPSGFRDETTYSYTRKDGAEELVASFGVLSRQLPTIDLIAADLRRRFDTVAAERGKVVEDSSIVLAGRRGRLLRLQLEDEGKLRENWLVVAEWRADRYVQIAYSADRAPSVEGRGRHILASASASDGAPRTASPGFVLRRLGEISFEVPDDLSGPKVFSFSSSDGLQTVKLRFSLAGDTEVLGFEAELKRAKRDGEVDGEIKTESLQLREGTAIVAQFEWLSDEPGPSQRETRCIAFVSLVNGVRISIQARGRERAGAINELVSSVTRSVELKR